MNGNIRLFVSIFIFLAQGLRTRSDLLSYFVGQTEPIRYFVFLLVTSYRTNLFVKMIPLGPTDVRIACSLNNV